MDYSKPLPTIDVWSRAFWDGTRAGELRMQRCGDCAHVFFPPGPVCPSCQSGSLVWETMSGRGEVVSWVVFHQLYFKGFADELPYNVTLVRLDEGPLMYTNVLGVPNDRLAVGMKLEATFDRATDEITIPRFRAVQA
jgi:uncharacterized OB-fold protein